MAPPFTAAAQRRDAETWIVTVSGELDLATAPQLEAVFEAVDATSSDRVRVDLAGVAFRED